MVLIADVVPGLVLPTGESISAFMNRRRQGFLCLRTASMEHADADTAEHAAVDHCFSSPTGDISVPVCLRTPEYHHNHQFNAHECKNEIKTCL